MTRRRPMTPARRLRILEAHDSHCYICGLRIDPTCEAWDVDHELALGLAGADDDSNWRPVHVDPCHKDKTRKDVQRMRKADAQKARHLGAKTPPRKPMAGSRASKWKKRMDGSVVER